MSTILLLIIAAASPWVVHLAPPRQRALALVGVVAVLLLFGIFAFNPLTTWQLWAGLAVGVASVLLASSAGRVGRGRGGARRRARFRERDEQTGEL